MLKRDWLHLTPLRGIIAGLALSILATAGVMGGVLLTLYDRDHQRADARKPDADNADIKSHCIDRLSFDDLVACVREKTDAAGEAKHNDTDLHAQQDVAALTVGILWFAAFGFVVSAAGVVLLIWTFQEQRKLTRAESRAYLEIISAHLGRVLAEDGDGQQIDILIVLHNNGNTPAFNVSAADLVMTCLPETNAWGDERGAVYKIKNFSGRVPEIPPKGTYTLQATATGRLPYPRVETGNWRYQGPSIYADGKLTFDDVFEKGVREMPLGLYANDLASGWFSDAIEFYGWHKSRVGGDSMPSHVKRAIEKAEEADRQKGPPWLRFKDRPRPLKRPRWPS